MQSPSRTTLDTSELPAPAGVREGTAGIQRRTSETLGRTPPPMRTLRPSGRFAALAPKELWQARELLSFLIWRNLKVRYKQTAIGAAWSVIQPVLLMLLLTVVFSHLANLSGGGVPYPVLVFAGLIPWGLFAYSLSSAGTSLVANENLITKVYFPRILIPSAAVLAGLFDAALGFGVLAAFFAYYGIVPPLAVLTLPLFVLMTVAVGLAVGIWLAALNVRYRDVQGMTGFLTQAWFYATPIAYPISIVPHSWRLFVGINPLAGVVCGIRWSLFHEVAFEPLVFVSLGVTAVLLAGALVYFSATERSFADVV